MMKKSIIIEQEYVKGRKKYQKRRNKTQNYYFVY